MIRFEFSPQVLEIHSNSRSFPLGLPVRRLDQEAPAPHCHVKFIVEENIISKRGTIIDQHQHAKVLPSFYNMTIANLLPVLPINLKLEFGIRRVNATWEVYVNTLLWNLLKVPFKARLDLLYSPINLLIDTICVALLEKGLYLMHAGGFSDGCRAAIVMGVPGTGKSTTVLRALTHGFKFLGEEYVITDGKKIYSVPYSTSFLEIQPAYIKFKKRTHQAYVSIRNLITRRAFPLRLLLHLLPYPKVELDSLNIPIEVIKDSELCRIYILERGPYSIRRINELSESIKKILHLNREEFSFFGNRFLLRYALVDESFDIDKLMDIERSIVTKMVENAETFICSAGNPSQFFDLIWSTWKD